MDCINCGASLSPKSNLCRYCGTLNDVDLRAIHRESKRGPASDRNCPRCAIPMQTIDLQVAGNLYIEQCEKCLGIFFDPGELESLLDASVSKVFEIDFDRMANLSKEEGPEAAPEVVYVKCPLCGTLMNRENYGKGARSGVILDVCKNHGVWLDGGELSKLLKWVKAGGLLFADKKQAEQARKYERKIRAASRGADSLNYSYGITSTVGQLLRLLR